MLFFKKMFRCVATATATATATAMAVPQLFDNETNGICQGDRPTSLGSLGGLLDAWEEKSKRRRRKKKR